MAKAIKSYRLETDTIEGVQSYAAAHELTETQAVEKLLGEALATGSQPVGKEANADVSSQACEALISQLAIKDKQIESLTEQISALVTLTNQAQQLHALTEAQTIEKTGSEKGGFFKRLFS